jgi:hypothetical protein
VDLRVKFRVLAFHLTVKCRRNAGTVAGIEEFSLEVHHGGFFVGFGELRSYVDEKIDWFDQIECDTWSSLWFDNFMQQLGYTIPGPSTKFYWLLPGKTIADGLRFLSLLIMTLLLWPKWCKRSVLW